MFATICPFHPIKVLPQTCYCYFSALVIAGTGVTINPRTYEPSDRQFGLDIRPDCWPVGRNLKTTIYKAFACEARTLFTSETHGRDSDKISDNGSLTLLKEIVGRWHGIKPLCSPSDQRHAEQQCKLVS